jgi:uncharacterized protein YegP (UPF0339 family)
MEFRGYRIIREQNGNAFRWHVYDQNGCQMTTRLGYRSKAAAKRFAATLPLGDVTQGAEEIEPGEAFRALCAGSLR